MKELIISKELISEVFKLNICEAYIENNNLYFDMGLPLIQSINLYEFAFKCKKWAENKGYIIFSKNKECLIYSIDEVYDVIECLNQYEDYFESDTEVQSIIKACNWILNNEKNPK